ncbi:hypothetical protein [Mycobacterium kyorinense]|uniref:hypothetical protein n=1 Tax=Mycobacterium kyorinense TaxID=487514 RepID=UPI001152E890|nr:hypothetical protein [Mycobacterium kyorinense]
MAVSAAVGSATTLLWLANENRSAPTVSSSPTSKTTTPATQFSAEEISAAKDNLCHIFDVSVRGQEGQGGLRVEGNLNVPVVLRAVNSAAAVQNALSPAVPSEVANASRKYISTTLDQTTAAMGNIPASEGNRLTDLRNEAIERLLDVCGLPR